MQKVWIWIVIIWLSFVPVHAEFRFRIAEDLGTLDWGYGEVNSAVVQQLMEGLTFSGPNGEALPALAEKWTFSKKNSSYEFEIRQNAKWSDGAPVCAQHFIDAWMRALSPQFASPYAHYFFDIKNAKQFNAGEKINPQIKTIGCHKLQITLDRPVAYFPALLSHWVFYPIRKDLIEKFGKKWTEPANLAVTGPYTLKEWKKDQYYLLTKNLSYYGVPAHEQTLRALVVPDDFTALNLFNAKQLDWIKDVPFLEKETLSKKKEYKTYPTFIGYHLGFLLNSPQSLPKNIRCALAGSLNKEEIPKILKGQETPAWGVLPPGIAPEVKNFLVQFDPKEAKALWGSYSKSIELYYYAKDVHTPIMEWAQEQWRKNLGAQVKLIKTEGKTYWNKLHLSPPLFFLSGITAAYAHPFSFLSEFLLKSHANWGHFASQKYDALAEQISMLNSEKHTVDLIKKAQQILIYDECAVIPLYFRQTSSLVANKWKEFSINPMGYVYLKNIH